MSLPIGDIITELNNNFSNRITARISIDFFHNVTVGGSDILCVDTAKYYCALFIKKKKQLRGFTICHKSPNKILKDPIIRKHYLEKKAEKYKNK